MAFFSKPSPQLAVHYGRLEGNIWLETAYRIDFTFQQEPGIYPIVYFLIEA